MLALGRWLPEAHLSIGRVEPIPAVFLTTYELRFVWLRNDAWPGPVSFRPQLQTGVVLRGTGEVEM